MSRVFQNGRNDAKDGSHSVRFVFQPIFLDLRLFASPKKSRKKSPFRCWNPSLEPSYTTTSPQVVPKQKRFRFVVPPGCQPGDVLTLQPTERLALNFRVPDNVEAFNVVTLVTT